MHTRPNSPHPIAIACPSASPPPPCWLSTESYRNQSSGGLPTKHSLSPFDHRGGLSMAQIVLVISQRWLLLLLLHIQRGNQIWRDSLCSGMCVCVGSPGQGPCSPPWKRLEVEKGVRCIWNTEETGKREVNRISVIRCTCEGTRSQTHTYPVYVCKCTRSHKELQMKHE